MLIKASTCGICVKKITIFLCKWNKLSRDDSEPTKSADF